MTLSPPVHPPEPTTKGPEPSPRRPKLSFASIVLGALALVSDIVGIAQWPTVPVAWLTVVAGSVAVLLGLPMVWVWSARRGTGHLAELFFAAAVTLSVLGAVFVGGGVEALRSHSPIGQTAGVDGRSSANGEPAIPALVEPAVRRQGDLTLKVGYEIDLDSVDPDWGVAQDSSDGDIENDLAVQVGSILAINKAQLARSTSVTYAACRGATAFGSTIRHDEEDAATAMLCVRTGQGRVVAIRITKVSREYGYFSEVQFSVTVW